MNKLFFSLIALVSLVAISCGTPESNTNNPSDQTAEQPSTVKNVQVADLKEALNATEDIVVLDVRTAGEVAQGYVNSALNVDVNGANFSQGVQELDTSKTIYVYCRSGQRSQKASTQLLELGFTDVRNVEGGFMAWEQAGYPIVK